MCTLRVIEETGMDTVGGSGKGTGTGTGTRTTIAGMTVDAVHHVAMTRMPAIAAAVIVVEVSVAAVVEMTAVVSVIVVGIAAVMVVRWSSLKQLLLW